MFMEVKLIIYDFFISLHNLHVHKKNCHEFAGSQNIYSHFECLMYFVIDAAQLAEKSFLFEYLTSAAIDFW